MRITKPRERWFPCPDDPDDGALLIREPTPKETRKLAGLVAGIKIEYKQSEDDEGKSKLEPKFTSDTDNATREKGIRETVRLLVKGWKNFYDIDGKPLKFNEENLMRAADDMAGFYEFVSECQEKIVKDIAEDKVAQKKT